MRLQGDRKGNTIWNFQSVKWKCRQRPEEGSPSTFQLYIYLKLVIWYSRRMRSRSLISWNLSLSSWVTVPTPSGLQISNVHGYHWNWIYRPGFFLLAFKTDHIDLMEKRGKVFFFFFFLWIGMMFTSKREVVSRTSETDIRHAHIHPNESTTRNEEKGENNQLNPSKDDRRLGRTYHGYTILRLTRTKVATQITGRTQNSFKTNMCGWRNCTPRFIYIYNTVERKGKY